MKIELEIEDNDFNDFIYGYNHALYHFFDKVKIPIFFAVSEGKVSEILMNSIKKRAIKEYGNDSTDSLVKIVDTEYRVLKDIQDQILQIEKEKKENNGEV